MYIIDLKITYLYSSPKKKKKIIYLYTRVLCDLLSGFVVVVGKGEGN